MNKVILIGRVTKEIELKYLPGKGTANTQFTLAVERQFKNKDGERETDFINCVCYGKPAETLANYVEKGNQLGVEGSLQIRHYEGKDGVKRTIPEVIVKDISILEWNKSEKKEDKPKDEYDDMTQINDNSEIPF